MSSNDMMPDYDGGGGGGPLVILLALATIISWIATAVIGMKGVETNNFETFSISFIISVILSLVTVGMFWVTVGSYNPGQQ